MKKLLLLNFIPSNADFGLLVLRVWLGLSMFMLHGIPKIQKFEVLKAGFPDPLGIGHQNSVTLAILSEGLASIFLILGLFTRGSALMLGITMCVAFFITHGAKLSGEGNGELAFIYLGGFITLFLCGAGKYSIDAKLGAR